MSARFHVIRPDRKAAEQERDQAARALPGPHSQAPQAYVPPLVGMARLLLVPAILFFVAFGAARLMPAVLTMERAASELGVAREAASQAQQTAGAVAAEAKKAAEARVKLAKAEDGLAKPDDLRDLGGVLDAVAKRSGASLVSVGFGTYEGLTLSQGKQAGTSQQAQATATAEKPAKATPYGKVHVDIVANGNVESLSRFMNALESSVTGFRIESWGVAQGQSSGVYQLQVAGSVYVIRSSDAQQVAVPSSGIALPQHP